MNILTYQQWTRTTAVYPEAGECSERELNYAALKLAGEAGEFADKVGKLYRAGIITLDPKHDTRHISIEHRQALVAEMGDVLWYLARLCDNFRIDLEELASLNVQKLELRKAEGQLGSITR